MNLRKKFSDPSKQEDGVWLAYEDADGDKAEFLIASADSDRYRNDLAKRGKSLAKLKDPSPALVTDITNKAIASALLLDWRGVQDEDGPVAATYESKLEAIERCPELKAWICEKAQEAANFRVEAEAAEIAALKSNAGVGA